MWYEIDLEVLKAKMKGLYYPSMLEVMTDGLKAFIWAEWDEQQKRYEIQHFNPGFRMGEWSEEFSVFGVNKNHDSTDEIALGMIYQGEIFSFGTCTECKFPKTTNAFNDFFPNQFNSGYMVLGADGGVYHVAMTDGVRYLFSPALFSPADDKIMKFEEFTGNFCRMARSEYIYINPEV